MIQFQFNVWAFLPTTFFDRTTNLVLRKQFKLDFMLTISVSSCWPCPLFELDIFSMKFNLTNKKSLLVKKQTIDVQLRRTNCDVTFSTWKLKRRICQFVFCDDLSRILVTRSSLAAFRGVKRQSSQRDRQTDETVSLVPKEKDAATYLLN